MFTSKDDYKPSCPPINYDIVERTLYDFHEEGKFRSAGLLLEAPITHQAFDFKGSSDLLDFSASWGMKSFSSSSLGSSVDSDMSEFDDFSYLCTDSDVMASSCDSIISTGSAFAIPEFTVDANDTLTLLQEPERLIEYSQESHNFSAESLKVAPLLPQNTSCIEKSKLFEVEGDAYTIANTIEKCLAKCSVFSFNSKYTFWYAKCKGNNYQFEVRLFKSDKADMKSHLIEIKRMSGCVIGFNAYYNRLSEAVSLATSGLLPVA
jgi:hypothetical protein